MNLLYHYTTIDTFAEKILPSLQLLMNKTEFINDPVESRFLIKLDDETYKKTLGLTSRLKLIKEGKKYNITCFSTDKEYNNTIIPGWGLPKMWAHYGNNHRGVCLIINKAKFLKQNEKKLKFEGLVRYKLKFKVPILDARRLRDGEKNNYFKEIIDTYFNEFFFQKHYDWRSEAEFRIVSFETEFCSISESIEGIIYGLKTPLYNEIGLSHIIENKKYINGTKDLLFPVIKFYKIVLSGSKFQLRLYKDGNFGPSVNSI
jgi:hypothetical protein